MANKSYFSPIFLIFLTLIIEACGGGSSPTPLPPVPAAKPEFLYVSTLDTSGTLLATGISAFTIDTATGNATPTATISKSILSLPFAIDSSSKFLYVTDNDVTGNTIDIYSLDPTTGKPTLSSQFSVTQPVCGPFDPSCQPIEYPGALAVSPKDNFLFYASANQSPPGQEIGSLAVSSSGGTLSTVPGSPFPANPAPDVIAVHPSGKFIYTEDLEDPMVRFFGLHSISGYSVDANGAISQVANSPFIPSVSANVGTLMMHPSGKFLYVSTGSASNGILAWSINTTTGELTALPNSPFMSGTIFTSGTIHPSGKFIYVSVEAPPRIAGFRVDSSSGSLTPLSLPSIGILLYSAVAVDPSGQYLYAANTLHNTLDVYKVDASTGSLTILKNSISVGVRPMALTIVKAP